MYLLQCLQLDTGQIEACLFSDHLVVRQGKGAMVVVFLRVVEGIQPTIRLPLHILHTLRQEAVVEGGVEVIRDQEVMVMVMVIWLWQ